MNKLLGVLRASDIDAVKEKTGLRFQEASKFKTPEALILYEQNMLDEIVIKNMCEEEYGCKLETPQQTYIPRDIINSMYGKNCVPISYRVGTNTLVVGVLPEFNGDYIESGNMNIEKVLVPIYYYVKLYTAMYSSPKFLYELPTVDKFSFICQEAINLQVSDITISNTATKAVVYYMCRKTKIHSKRNIEVRDVKDIVDLLMTRAGVSSTETFREPKFFSIRLDMRHRGRVVINRNYYGYMITIRVLSDDLLNTSLEDLNINPKTCEFIRNHVLSREKGLRLFIGETASGKNTTILASLLELVKLDKYKIVSVEQPVEILVDGIEQIDSETDEEFAKNADSLLRQNPDIVYFTEITERTAPSILKQANTGKTVFTSIHANSVADVISRLEDITKFSADRIILSLQSCIYQELVRDEEKDVVYPSNRQVHFSDELKLRLYGKSMAEIRTILSEVENA